MEANHGQSWANEADKERLWHLRLGATEEWCWTEKLTNNGVFSRAEETSRLLSKLKGKRGRLIGHILPHNGLMKRLIEVIIEGYCLLIHKSSINRY